MTPGLRLWRMKEEPHSRHDQQLSRRLDLSGSLSLAVAGLFGILGPAAFGQMHTLPGTTSPAPAQPPVTAAKRLEFEVASVRRNKSEEEASMNISPLLGDSPIPSGKLIPGKKHKAYPIHRFCL
jgi:hypothetical protein